MRVGLSTEVGGLMNKITTKYRCSIPGCLEMEVVLDDKQEVIDTIT